MKKYNLSFKRKDLIVIYIIIIYNIMSFYLRYLYLNLNLSNSYVYYLIPNYNNNTKAVFTIIIYTLYMIVYLLLYVFGLSFFHKKSNINFSLDKKYSDYIFVVSCIIELYRILIVGNVAGVANQSNFFKYLFFIQWFFSYKLFGFYLFIQTKKIRYLLVVIIVTLLSGMKGGVFQILIFWFFYELYFNKLNYKKIGLIILYFLMILLIFPIIYAFVQNIRTVGSVSISSFKLDIDYKNYYNQIYFMIEYIWKRLNIYEFFHVIILKYNLIDRSKINSLTFFVEIYNEFVPSFLQPNDLFLNRSMNNLYPILFFGQNLASVSSEAITIPGLMILYHGYYLGIIYVGILGWVMAYFYTLIQKIMNEKIRALFIINYYMFIFVFVQAASLSTMATLIKRYLSFIFLALLVKSYKRIKYTILSSKI